MRVHFIAIGGSAMHNLAIALHLKGLEVTGSDDAIFEPSASRLAKHQLLPENMGWYAENITSDIDAVILGMHAKADNPELLKARELELKIYSYPEYIFEQSKNKKRVVIGGSHGKTTITSMILHVLKKEQINFDYLVGAQLEGFENMVSITDAPLIIIEGDEYLSSPIDRRPKFHLYQANLALISGIAWDHINVFPTFENYKEQFRLFLKTITPDGMVAYCDHDEVLKKVITADDSPILKVPYGLPAYQIKKGVTCLVSEKLYPLQIFGKHNLLNLEGAKTICLALGINENAFYEAMGSFKGAARRLELIVKSETVNIYKDFAHSPSKLTATVQAVKDQFPERKLIACMELHTFSSLNENFLTEYKGTLNAADEAIVFVDKNVFERKGLNPYSAQTVRNAFLRQDILFFDCQNDLVSHLTKKVFHNENLLLMSSGNFSGINLSSLADELLRN